MKIPPTPITLSLTTKVGTQEPKVVEFAKFEMPMNVTTDGGQVNIGLDLPELKAQIAGAVLALAQTMEATDIVDLDPDEPASTVVNGPSEAAVEAAARGLYEYDFVMNQDPTWGEVEPPVRATYLRAARAALAAALPVEVARWAAPLRAACFQSDDGTEFDHVENCEGEDTCPACWAEEIRRHLDALPGGEQP